MELKCDMRPVQALEDINLNSIQDLRMRRENLRNILERRRLVRQNNDVAKSCTEINVLLTKWMRGINENLA